MSANRGAESARRRASSCLKRALRSDGVIELLKLLHRCRSWGRCNAKVAAQLLERLVFESRCEHQKSTQNRPPPRQAIGLRTRNESRQLVETSAVLDQGLQKLASGRAAQDG